MRHLPDQEIIDRMELCRTAMVDVKRGLARKTGSREFRAANKVLAALDDMKAAIGSVTSTTQGNLTPNKRES